MAKVRAYGIIDSLKKLRCRFAFLHIYNIGRVSAAVTQAKDDSSSKVEITLASPKVGHGVVLQ